MSEPHDPNTPEEAGDEASPDSQPALSKRSRVAQGLQQLFGEADQVSHDEPVPGASDSLQPPAPTQMPDLQSLAEELAQTARNQSSALAKSRGLLVAAQLYAHTGAHEEATEAARQSAETSPKLGLAALSLRKKASSAGGKESVERSLEAATRLASQKSSRAHAIRLLVEHLNSEGRAAEMGQVLDHAARSGDADETLLLQRLVHRLSQGSSLAGVDVPDALKSAVNDTQVILGGASSDESSAPELAALRAARLLAERDLEGTVKELGKLAVPQEAVSEMQAALLVAEPDRVKDAATLLKKLSTTAPSKRVLRRLARLSVQLRDRVALSTVLDQSDPGSGTFSLTERWFLSACTGQQLQIAREDAVALSVEEPALAVALSPSDTPAPDVASASTGALLAQVGAGFLRITRPGLAQPLSGAALEALGELKARGAHQEVRASLEALLAQTSDQEQLFAESLIELSEAPERAAGQLIGAAILQRVGAHEAAERSYRAALTGSEALASSAARGLVELGTEDAFDVLHSATKKTEDPRLNFAHQLSAALEGAPGERATVALNAVSALLEAEGGSDDLRSEESALLLAASSAAAQAGDETSARKAQEKLSRQKSFSGAITRLRLQLDGKSVQPLEDERDAEQSERMLGFWRNEPLPLNLPEPEAEGRTESHPASEVLLHFARSILRGDREESARLGSCCADVDHSAAALGIDLQKLNGKTEELNPLWLERAKSTDNPDSQRFAYERLAELDELRGDYSSALLWHRTLAEEFPEHLPSLLRFEESLLTEAKPTLPATERLAQALPDAEGRTYQLIFGALALAQSDLRDARKHLEPLLQVSPPPLLALRGLVTIGHEKREDDLLLRAYQHLAERPGGKLDRCARALSRALILARLGRNDEATEWARQATEAEPRAFAAQQLLHFLHTPDDLLERGEQLEAFGLSAATNTHRAELLFEAGKTFDEADDPSRASECYEKTLEASPDHREAFSRLCERRESGGALEQVEQLIIARLALIQVGSSEHLELELKLASLLAAQDKPEEVKKHLEEALATHPGHTGALHAHADVSAQLGAHDAAEKSLVALRDKLPTGEERTEVMRSLARLYDEHLGQTEKAMDAYQAVLEETPDDERARADLVRIYSQLGLPERATAMQTKIIQSANSPEKKRDGALRLAEIYEKVAGDPKRAGATLERTRKAWPLDGAVLEATVQFMDRQGTGGPRGFLLDRAGKDARRKLESGRLDGGLLDTLARVARLSGQIAQAESNEAARHAYDGSPGDALKGAGLSALDPKIDDLLAPKNFPAPLRTLLRKTGAAMDAAFSVDLAAMGARSLTSGATFDRMAQIAKAFGTDAPGLFVSDALGAKCLPVTTEPARLLIGSDLDQLPERERDYLLLRALKLRWLGAGALARSKDEDRWPMLVALLHLFAPNWRPSSVDGRKAAQAKALIEQGLARVGYDDDVPMLALEVIGALGSQTANVGDQPRVLANRVALLGIGDPAITLSAIARSEGAKLASGGPSRFRWLESHPEAKDLLLFSTTDKCARARETLGLVEPSQPIGSGAGAPAAPPKRSPGAAPPAPRRSMPAAPPRRPKPPPPKR